MEQMSNEEAVLYQGVYVPEFIEKCAAAGLQIRTEEDLADALQIADRIRLVKEASGQPVRSEPAAEGGILKRAAAGLDEILFGDQRSTSAYLDNPDIRAAAEALTA